MLIKNSRYHTTPTATASDESGRKVTMITLRKLPAPEHEQAAVHVHDRLDILAHARYGDQTKFWHIADANSELEAARLNRNTNINLPKHHG